MFCLFIWDFVRYRVDIILDFWERFVGMVLFVNNNFYVLMMDLFYLIIRRCIFEYVIVGIILIVEFICLIIYW